MPGGFSTDVVKQDQEEGGFWVPTHVAAVLCPTHTHTHTNCSCPATGTVIAPMAVREDSQSALQEMDLACNFIFPGCNVDPE